ncbi:MAG: hypothetical protein ACLU4P_06310 [Ruminococcus sp.]
MSKTVYDYMDWPEIEAVVYGEETAPRDVMGPRLTPDGRADTGLFRKPGLRRVGYRARNI